MKLYSVFHFRGIFNVNLSRAQYDTNSTDRGELIKTYDSQVAWFKHIYLAKHRTISTITTFVSVRGFERKLQVAYRVHLLNAWYIVIFMADNWHIYENK